jgi:predicted metalloprotease with PDZ domain
MKSIPALAAAVLLTAASPPASAAEPAPKPNPVPAPAPAPDVEKKLMEARERLEQAAREVAQLSQQMVGEDFARFRTGTRRAMLGVQLGERREQGGVRVAGVSPGGPAATAGLKQGDVIVSVNGQKIADARDVAERVRGLPPGSHAKVDVERDGKVQTYVVVTREMDPVVTMMLRRHGGSDDGDLPDLPMLDGAPLNMAFERVRPWGDLEVATLTKDLGRYFGAERGVLVVKAPSDGALKLRDGDVITAIDGREPQNGSHAIRILRSYQPGEQLTLAILRERKAQKLDVTVPNAPTGGPRMRGAPPAPPAPPTGPVAPAPVSPASPASGADAG